MRPPGRVSKLENFKSDSSVLSSLDYAYDAVGDGGRTDVSRSMMQSSGSERR